MSLLIGIQHSVFFKHFCIFENHLESFVIQIESVCILFTKIKNTFATFFFFQGYQSMLYKTLNISIDTYSEKVVKA